MAKDKAQAAPASHDEVDLDELLDVSRSRNIYLNLVFTFCVQHIVSCHIDSCQISSNFSPGPRT